MFSNRIGQYRANLGLTQKEFAKRIGYSRSYLAEIESGKVKPSGNFLEAVSKVFNMSIDALMTDSIIIDAIDANRGTENPDIIFVFSFTQDGIDGLEKLLRSLLKDRKVIFVDARGIKTWVQLLEKILNKKEGLTELHNALKMTLLNDEVMLVIKNLTLSNLPKKEIGYYIRDIFKIMDDAWETKQESFRHKKPKSSLILLDFPSLLEKYYSEIGFYTIPVYSEFELASIRGSYPSYEKKQLMTDPRQR